MVANPWEAEKAYQFLSAQQSLPVTFGAGNDDSDPVGSMSLLHQPTVGMQGGKSSNTKPW